MGTKDADEVKKIKSVKGLKEIKAQGKKDPVLHASVHSLLTRSSVEEFDDSIYDPRLAADPAYLFEKKRLIHPDAVRKLVWDLVIYTLSIYSVSTCLPYMYKCPSNWNHPLIHELDCAFQHFIQVLSVTMRAGFSLPSSLGFFVFDVFVNTLFAFDIVLTFFTAEWSRVEKTFITNQKVLAILYLRGWFCIDVISTVSKRVAAGTFFP